MDLKIFAIFLALISLKKFDWIRTDTQNLFILTIKRIASFDS